jgi:hypothetical protein
MNRLQASRDAGRCHRPQADMEFLPGRAEVCLDRMQVDVRTRAAVQRGVDEKVVNDGGRTDLAGEQVASPGEGAQYRFYHAGGT